MLTVPREQTHSACPIVRARHRPPPRVTAASPAGTEGAGLRRGGRGLRTEGVVWREWAWPAARGGMRRRGAAPFGSVPSL